MHVSLSRLLQRGRDFKAAELIVAVEKHGRCRSSILYSIADRARSRRWCTRPPDENIVTHLTAILNSTLDEAKDGQQV